MEHEVNASCQIQFDRINVFHKRIEDDLNKLMVVVLGNGKQGLKEDVAQLHRDFIEIRGAMYEQDKILEEIIKSGKEAGADKMKSEENKKSEILKFVLTTIGVLFAGALQFVTVYFLWKLTGQMP
jgi:hypothetical protein